MIFFTKLKVLSLLIQNFLTYIFTHHRRTFTVFCEFSKTFYKSRTPFAPNDRFDSTPSLCIDVHHWQTVCSSASNTSPTSHRNCSKRDAITRCQFLGMPETYRKIVRIPSEKILKSFVVYEELILNLRPIQFLTVSKFLHE